MAMKFCESWGDHVRCAKCVHVVGVSRYSEAHCYMGGEAVCALLDASVCCNVCVCVHVHGYVLMECIYAFWGLSALMGSVFMLWNMFVQ